MEQYKEMIQIYTDGSKDKQNNVGNAVYVKHSNNFISNKLPSNTSIFSAELLAIKTAIDWIGEKAKDLVSKEVVIFTDSLSSLLAIETPRKHYNNHILQAIINKIEQNRIKTHIAWIPAHCGILGNEKADIHAKQALNKSTITLTYVQAPKDHKKMASHYIKNLWEQRLKEKEHNTTNFKIQPKVTFKPKYENTNRFKEIIITRLRLGRTITNRTLYQMKNLSTDKCDHCDQSDTFMHSIVHCPNSPLVQEIAQVSQQENI